MSTTCLLGATRTRHQRHGGGLESEKPQGETPIHPSFHTEELNVLWCVCCRPQTPKHLREHGRSSPRLAVAAVSGMERFST